MSETQHKSIPYSLILTLIITIAGYGVTFGVCQNRIDQNAKDIARIERRQDTTDTILQSINSQLVELNTKMSLLLNGKLSSAE